MVHLIYWGATDFILQTKFVILSLAVVLANDVDTDEMWQLCNISSGPSLFAKVGN